MYTYIVCIPTALSAHAHTPNVLIGTHTVSEGLYVLTACIYIHAHTYTHTQHTMTAGVDKNITNTVHIYTLLTPHTQINSPPPPLTHTHTHTHTHSLTHSHTQCCDKSCQEHYLTRVCVYTLTPHTPTH